MTPKIELQIYCAVCGEGLCEQTKVERSTKLFVQPCKNCLQEKWEEGEYCPILGRDTSLKLRNVPSEKGE